MAASLVAHRIFPPTPKQLALTGTPPNFVWGNGTPAGTIASFSSQPKGTFYIQADAADNTSCWWQKVANNAADADWAPVFPDAGLTSVNVTSATLTVTSALHAGRVMTLNRAAGIAVTLPTAIGSGAVYKFVVGTTFTGAASIAVADSSDYMIGTALLFQDGGDTTAGFSTANTGTLATESDTISLFGTANAQGGIKGEVIEITDIATDIWHIRLVSDAGGTEATPFSAAV